MWVFLVTEIMFFGGLFTAYVVYRGTFHGAFAAAATTLDRKLGALNTAVLIAQQLDHGAGDLGGAGEPAEADRRLPARRRSSWARPSSASRRSSTRTSSSTTSCPGRTSTSHDGEHRGDRAGRVDQRRSSSSRSTSP